MFKGILRVILVILEIFKAFLLGRRIRARVKLYMPEKIATIPKICTFDIAEKILNDAAIHKKMMQMGLEPHPLDRGIDGDIDEAVRELCWALSGKANRLEGPYRDIILKYFS